MRKIKIGIIFGGKTAEHEVSIQSAKNIIQTIDKEKYDVTPLVIDKEGKWHVLPLRPFLEFFKTSQLLDFDPQNFIEKTKEIIPSQRHFQDGFDIIFPALHGPLGEDGTVQGLLELIDIPYVGSGVLGSAIGMDKDVMKRLLRDAGIKTARFLSMHRSTFSSFDEVVNYLGLPFFIKPANLGSSVGIHKVKKEEDYLKALENAFSYDYKVLAEEYIRGKEIECSVLGNEYPTASLPCEIIPQHEYYSYEAKYIDENGALFVLPAQLDQDLLREIQATAIKAFKVCCMEGMARVDFFLNENQELFVNELNTIPGFTQTSMYPKMWETSGLSYKDLIDRLIMLGFQRFERQRKLLTNISISYKINN